MDNSIDTVASKGVRTRKEKIWFAGVAAFVVLGGSWLGWDKHFQEVSLSQAASKLEPIVKQAYELAVGPDLAFSFSEQEKLARGLGYTGIITERESVNIAVERYQTEFLRNPLAGIFLHVGDRRYQISEDKVREYIANNS